LTQTYPRFAGDTAGPFIRDLARGLVRGGDQVTVLTPHASDVPAAWDDDGVDVRSFRYAPERLELVGYSRSLDRDETLKGGTLMSAPLYALGARRAIRATLKEQARKGRPIDLIHAHWVVPNALIAAASGLAAPGLGAVPLVVGLHGSDVFLAEKWGVRSLVGWALGKAAVLTGCSPELVDRVCALGFDPARSRVIPYGVDSDLFAPDPQSDSGPDPQSDSGSDVGQRNHWRQRLNIPSDAPMIVSVGRMATKKGYQVLMPGLGDFFARCPRAHVVLAGAGDRLEEFRQAAAAWPTQVHFPGAVLRDTIADLYRAADIFVLPAVHDPQGNVDGLPNVILEAMASGLPVVTTPISGIPLAITEGENGRLVPEGETAPLIDALVDLVAAPATARAMGRAGREKARRELSWDAVAARYRAAYGLVLSDTESAGLGGGGAPLA
jgi:glycosyltransferase involved in cell wall biosynthesis